MPYTAAFLIYNKLYIVYRSYELFSYVCLFSLYIHIFFHVHACVAWLQIKLYSSSFRLKIIGLDWLSKNNVLSSISFLYFD